MKKPLDPDKCPKCGSTQLEVTMGGPEDMGRYQIHKTCVDCGANISIEYAVVAVDVID